MSSVTNFPTANVASDDGGTYQQYFITSPNSLEIVGTYVTNFEFIYTDNEKIMQYPFTFGDSFTDTWASYFNSGTQVNRGGSSQVTADGYGTITLPNGTFANVLRVSQTQNYADTFPSIPMDVYQADNILWYLPGVHFPIAVHSELIMNSSPVGSADAYMNPIWPTAVEDIKSLETFISYYPNPANDKLNIKALENIRDAEIVLCTMNGAQVIKQSLITGSTSTIDVSTLANGTYLMHFRNNGKNVAGEIITVKH